MFCVTPDGIRANVEMQKGDPKDTGPISRILSTHFAGIYQNSAGVEEIDMRHPSQSNIPFGER